MKPPSVKFLVLRILEAGPKSGYEIMKEVEKVLGSSYPGSIYPILRWWEEKGYVEKRDKYVLTKRGKEFLRELERKRSEYLERIKRDLIALSRALGDREMEKLASYLPLREKIGDEGVFLLARLVELLVSCKDRGKILEGVKKLLGSGC